MEILRNCEGPSLKGKAGTLGLPDVDNAQLMWSNSKALIGYSLLRLVSLG